MTITTIVFGIDLNDTALPEDFNTGDFTLFTNDTADYNVLGYEIKTLNSECYRYETILDFNTLSDIQDYNRKLNIMKFADICGSQGIIFNQENIQLHIINRI